MKAKGLTSAKRWIKQLQTPLPPQKNKKNKQKLSEPTMSGCWQNSPRFTAIKQMLNQEKGDWETVGQLSGSFSCPGTPPSLLTQSLDMQPTFLLWDPGL